MSVTPIFPPSITDYTKMHVKAVSNFIRCKRNPLRYMWLFLHKRYPECWGISHSLCLYTVSVVRYTTLYLSCRKRWTRCFGDCLVLHVHFFSHFGRSIYWDFSAGRLNYFQSMYFILVYLQVITYHGLPSESGNSENPHRRFWYTCCVVWDSYLPWVEIQSREYHTPRHTQYTIHMQL